MAKRGNGEGSIYRRKEDGKWVSSITLENGKRRVVYGKTRAEAKNKLIEALQEQQKGMLVVSGPLTVAQFLTDWLENTHKRLIRPRTYERYREAIYLHLIPVLGQHQLQKLTVQHIQAFYAKKEEEGLAPATIVYYHSVLHNALNTGIKRGLISRNVCNLADPPRKEHYEIQPLSIVQAQKFLSAIENHKWKALYALAIATGLRRGEILGLKWQDVNFKNGTLQVQRILSRVPTQTPKRVHVYVEAEPKTKRSRRNIVIAPFALEALDQHRMQQAEIRSKAGETWKDHDYVFCTMKGTHLNPNHVVEELKKILLRAELPNIRFHDLRHSAATFLFVAGVHPKIVQEFLGHTQISTTMDIYSHMLPGMQEDAVNKLHDALKRKDDDDEGLAGAGVPKRPRE
ncbi:tyrosine-type recombinase/integrase [Ktedonosporobacter rubrisoli]|nr:tyrosine-type recombinase/integrase [Ktedonosporobacter rubrisoli]